MSVHNFKCRGGRGELDLYYEEGWVAVDVTEDVHLRGHARSTEVFLGVEDVDRLIAALADMKNTIITNQQERTA